MPDQPGGHGSPHQQGQIAMKDFSPLQALERAFRTWWLWVLLAFLGGLLGLLTSHLLPPLYEAHAEFYVSLDEAQLADELRTEELTLLMKEDVLGPVEETFFSENVLSSVDAAAQAQQIDIDIETIRKDFSLYRVHTTWFLVVQNNDPQSSVELANLWAESADQFLQGALVHAVEANSLELLINSVSRCFEELNFQEANQCAATSFAGPEDLQVYIQDASERLEAERDASFGVHHTLDYEYAASAISSDLVRYPRGWLCLSGMLVGFIIGIAISQVRKGN